MQTHSSWELSTTVFASCAVSTYIQWYTSVELSAYHNVRCSHCPHLYTTILRTSVIYVLKYSWHTLSHSQRTYSSRALSIYVPQYSSLALSIYVPQYSSRALSHCGVPSHTCCLGTHCTSEHAYSVLELHLTANKNAMCHEA